MSSFASSCRHRISKPAVIYEYTKVGHLRGENNSQPLAKTNQFSKFAAHCLVWSEIFQIMEEWLYTVVLTCVVGVTDINNINFSVAGRLKNQVRPQYCIVLYTVQNLKGM